jgi:hypothetical protein
MTQKMQFSWTVNLGQVLSFSGFLIAGAGVYFGLVSRIDTLDFKDGLRAAEYQELRKSVANIETKGANAIEKFQLQVNQRMDTFSVTLTTLSTSTARTEANVEALIRNDMARKGQ